MEYTRDCPNYFNKPNRDPVTGKDWGGEPWCLLIDHPCMMETDGHCDTWEAFKREMANTSGED